MIIFNIHLYNILGAKIEVSKNEYRAFVFARFALSTIVSQVKLDCLSRLSENLLQVLK